jgi:exonuclease SbcC
MQREHATRIDDLRRKLDQVCEEIERARKAEDRLASVPCHGEGEFAGCSLIAAAAQARDGLAALIASKERIACDLAVVTNPPAELLAAKTAHAEICGREPKPFDDNDLRVLDAKRGVLVSDVKSLRRATEELRALDGATEQLSAVETEIAEMEEAATAADEMTKYLAGCVEASKVAVERAAFALDLHQDERPACTDEGALQRLRDAERAAAAHLGACESAMENVRLAAAECAELRAAFDSKSAHIDDWRAIQVALGKNGVQALEIDAAGPEVSQLTNDLLHACYGSRFSVSLETTQLKADGKGTKEIFDLRVIDTERGTEGSAAALSGGEKVLVSEALALAIAIYNTHRSSIPMLDLFRDECAGALSEANAALYIEMLRRALDLGGFNRCYYVAHQPSLWAMADARIRVANGDVTLE